MNRLIFALGFITVFVACSNPHPYNAFITGNVVVADSLADSEDNSGIYIQIYTQNLNETVDTLFSTATSKNGDFEGSINFPNPGPYPVKISRYGRQISTYTLILGDKDTVKVSGEIPGFAQSAKVASREADAYATFQRVEKGYTRILNFIGKGSFEPDTIPTLVRTWSDLYWSVWEEYPTSYGGYLAQAQSASMVRGYNDSLAMVRLKIMDNDPFMTRVSATLGMRLLTKMQGLDAALSYGDSLKKASSDKYDRANISQFQIDLLYDSLRVEQGRKLFGASRSEFGDIRAFREWASEFEDDYSRLAPGEPSPEYSLWFSDEEIPSDSLIGTAILLEFTGLGNKAYQEQYDRIRGLNTVYQNFGLQIVTIPVDTSRVAVQAFIQEYGQFWPFTDVENYQRDSLQTKFNITRLPTRVLIDPQGKIVRKYVGGKISILFDDVLKLFKNEEAT